MSKQISFADLGFNKEKQPKRCKFLTEMDQVVPWNRLVKRIATPLPKGGKWHPSQGHGTDAAHLFRAALLYSVGPAMGDGVYESTSVRRFLKLVPLTDSVPDESTILRFRHLLKAHALAGKLFGSVNADLVDKGLLLRGGSMLEATLIAAPGSTKNQEPKRDPEMSSTNRGA